MGKERDRRSFWCGNWVAYAGGGGGRGERDGRAKGNEKGGAGEKEDSLTNFGEQLLGHSNPSIVYLEATFKSVMKRKEHKVDDQDTSVRYHSARIESVP